MKQSNLIFAVLVIIVACNTPQPKSDLKPPTRQIIMTTMLKDSVGVIETYERYHSPEGVWPEIIQANQAAGIQKVEIYRQGRRLVMILTVPEDWDSEEADRAYANADDRVKEWGEIMGGFQAAPPDSKPGQVWVPMDRIHLYESN